MVRGAWRRGSPEEHPGDHDLMSSFLSGGGAGAMWARLESPRASYATPGPWIGMTRAPRRRQLPTNHGHAARPLGATRAYQPDSSSKTPHLPLRVAPLRNSLEPSGPDPPKNSLDGRSFHISQPVLSEACALGKWLGQSIV